MSLVWTQACVPQVRSPYAEFDILSGVMVDSIQVKLTYIRRLEKIQTLAFTTNGRPFDREIFRPFYRSEFSYRFDGAARTRFGLTRSQMEVLVDSVGTVPEVVDGGVDANPLVSFALSTRVAGVARVFESVLGEESLRKLYRAMIGAVQGNPEAVRELSVWGCGLNLLPEGAVAVVDAQAEVKLSGIRYDHTRGHYVGKIRVRNIGQLGLQAPVLVSMKLEGGVQVLGPDGFTCKIEPPGMPYLTVLQSGVLQPGAEVSRAVTLLNPNQDVVRPVVMHVAAGSGIP